jgi:hypothetical protein
MVIFVMKLLEKFLSGLLDGCDEGIFYLDDLHCKIMGVADLLLEEVTDAWEVDLGGR